MTSKTISEKIEYPEDGNEADRYKFYVRVADVIGDAPWIAAILYPSFFDDYPTGLESDLRNSIHVLKMPYKGTGWLFSREILIDVLPAFFGALTPEFILLAFDEKPSPDTVYTAWNSADATPAKKVLFFDWSELVEVRVSDNGLGDEILKI